jgi:hypothetical protein
MLASLLLAPVFLRPSRPHTVHAVFLPLSSISREGELFRTCAHHHDCDLPLYCCKGVFVDVCCAGGVPVPTPLPIPVPA